MENIVPPLSRIMAPFLELAELSHFLGKAMAILKALLGARFMTRLLKLLTKALSFRARSQLSQALLSNVMLLMELVQLTPMALLLVVVWLAIRPLAVRLSSRSLTLSRSLLLAGLTLECPKARSVKPLGRAIQLSVPMFL